MNAEQEQALAAFEHAADELRFFKGQQWAVSNYALILQAALASIPQAFNLRHLSTAIGKERGRMATPGPACRYLRAFTGRYPPARRQPSTAVMLGAVVLLARIVAQWMLWCA